MTLAGQRFDYCNNLRDVINEFCHSGMLEKGCDVERALFFFRKFKKNHLHTEVDIPRMTNLSTAAMARISMYRLFQSTSAPADINTSALPVSHCSQPTAFGALNRKARETRRDEKTA